MNRLICALVFLFVFTFAPARGQSSADAVVEPWQLQIEAFAAGLSNGERFDSAISSDATVRRLGETETQSIRSISSIVAGSRVISARSGTNPMISLASDLSTDARAAELEAELLRVLEVSDHKRRNADSVAARWLASEVGAQTEDPIALVVLFQPGETSQQLHFILVRGRQQTNGKIVIIHAVHATLDQLLG